VRVDGVVDLVRLAIVSVVGPTGEERASVAVELIIIGFIQILFV
jgi:hypothetical protein